MGPKLIGLPFRLSVNYALDNGFGNVLRVRELDIADNASPEASVTLTSDVVPPKPIRLSTFYVDNANGSASVRWNRSASTDVASWSIAPTICVSSPRITSGMPAASRTVTPGTMVSSPPSVSTCPAASASTDSGQLT